MVREQGFTPYINFGNFRFMSHRGRGSRSCITGFTVVEVIVVTAIITMLASLAFVQFRSLRARARDVEREQEIGSLQKALALYVADARTFPVYSGAITGVDPLSLAVLDAGAIDAIPKDPLSTGEYVYSYESSGPTYTITYSLETDSIPGKNKGLQTAAP